MGFSCSWQHIWSNIESFSQDPGMAMPVNDLALHLVVGWQVASQHEMCSSSLWIVDMLLLIVV